MKREHEIRAHGGQPSFWRVSYEPDPERPEEQHFEKQTCEACNECVITLLVKGPAPEEEG